jgi:hypothetical protein
LAHVSSEVGTYECESHRLQVLSAVDYSESYLLRYSAMEFGRCSPGFRSSVLLSPSRPRSNYGCFHIQGNSQIWKILCVIKVKFSLFLTKLALCNEVIWWSGRIHPRFLILATGWRCVISSTPLPLYPLKEFSVPSGQDDWVGPRTGFDNMEKGRFLILRGLEFRS